MAEKEEIVRFVVRVPACLNAEFQRQCKEYERSKNAQILWLIKEWIRECHEANVTTPA